MTIMHINWYPGHMAKARRMIIEQIKLVDVVIELLDARIPQSSANPVIDAVVAAKPRVVVLNKADLAEAVWTERWLAHFQALGRPAIAVETISGAGTKLLTSRVEAAAREKMARLSAKGILPRAVRAMILGIPNVGKSSLINRLLGTATVRTGDKPGVTRGQQWLKVGKNLELLDTPGVLWPKLEDQEVAFKLAITSAISDDAFDLEDVATRLLILLRESYSDRLTERFKLDNPLPEAPDELLDRIGERRGCLRGGGQIDRERARRLLLAEFREGKMGRFTLDYPLTN
ncbi:MAG: ribosome biogenesis GTPase YlqF [Negativicutes bacterium]|nr:ribosome biogenesis GTPase YlqF [Negativicutes bacterium]